MIAATIAGAVLGKDRAGQVLEQQLTALIGADSAKIIRETGEKAAEATHGTWITTTDS